MIDQKASEKEQDDQEKDSVFDFLYNDTRRVASFLAQFDDSGYLEKVVQKDAVTKGRKRGFKWSVGGGATLAGTGGQGTVALERSPSDEGSESLERSYDPLWTNARTLLDFLSERNLIQRDLMLARLGQFVLVSGSLVVLDLPLIKNAWGKSTVQKLIRAGADQELRATMSRQQRRAAGKNAAPETLDGANLLIDLMSILPHSLQGRIFTDIGVVWCNLIDNFVVGQSNDLVLKHGSLIPGQWSVLGILDAFPDNLSVPNEDGKTISDVIAEAAGTVVGNSRS